MAVVLLAACGGGSSNAPQYQEYECPAPIGRIVREDCSRSALRYEGTSFAGSVGAGGVGASASYKEQAIREADGLVAMLKEQRVQLCNDFNTCKMPVSEYREEQKRLDDSFIALLALKDKMAAIDAEAAAKLLEQIQSIRARTRPEAQRAAASVGGADGGFYSFRNKNSDLCVAVSGGSTASAAKLIQYTCHGGADERWRLVPQADGFVTLFNKNSGKCVAVDGGATTKAAPIIQWECHGGNDEQWKPIEEASGFVTLKNRNSGLCLTVDGGATTNATRLIQWDCHDGSDERWRLVRLE